MVGYKIDEVDENNLDGVYEDPNSDFTVTISNTDPEQHTFDYLANRQVNVFVKGGPGGQSFGPALSGQGLHAPTNPNTGQYHSISHITFCFIPPETTIEVVKTPDDQMIPAGDDIVFTIGVIAGEEAAREVTLSDPLPGGTAGPWSITAQPDGGPCSILAGELVCQFGDIEARGSVSVTVSAPTSPGDCAIYDNEAQAQAANAPPASDTARVSCQTPDLVVEKTGNGEISAGDRAVFKIRLTNKGPGLARKASISDPLPGGALWEIESQPPGQPCAISDALLSCQFGDLDAEESKEVTIEAPTGAESCQQYANRATAAALNNPETEDQATVICQPPEISIEKTGNGAVSAGQKIKFKMLVANRGPGKARGVALSDPLPLGTAGPWKISSQPAGQPCEIGAGRLDCQLGEMEPGHSHAVWISAPTSRKHCSTYENTAIAQDSYSGQQSDSASVSCRSQVSPRLVLKKTASKTRVSPGGRVRFTLSFRNKAPDSVARKLLLCDPLPGRMAYLNRGGGFLKDGKLCWKIDQLPFSRNWKKKSFRARIDRTSPAGTLLNVATLSNGTSSIRATRRLQVRRPDNPPKFITPVTG